MENNSPQILKRSSDFLSIKQTGKRHWPTKWLLMNFKKSTEGQMHFGTTASRKVGPAVVRNKLKRWVREYFRALPKAGPFLEADINIIFKPMDSNFYKGLRHEDFVQAMDRGVQNIRKHI